MSSNRTETAKFREGLFRFGQWFSRQNIKFVYYRDPIANLVVKGLIDDAMSKGFDVVETGTDKHVSWNDELQKVMINHYDEWMQTIYFQRRDGKALQTFMQRDGKLINIAGSVNQYRLYKNNLGQPTKGTFRVEVDGYSGIKTEILDATVDNFMELIVGRREKVGEGLSVLEPIWDVLFALYMLISHSAYFIARAGAGLKRAKLPEEALTDAGSTDILTTLAQAMTDFGAASDTIIVPESIGGVPVDFEIMTVDSPMDFSALLDMFITIIAAHLGVPQSTIKGLVPGQQAGALVNEESYFDFQRDLQSKYVKYCKWLVKQLNKFYKFNIGSDDVKADLDYDILYRVRQVMSDDDEMVLLAKKLGVAKQLKDLGLNTLKAFKHAKIKGITKGDLREGIDEPIEMLPNASGQLPPAEGDESSEDEDDDAMRKPKKKE